MTEPAQPARSTRLGEGGEIWQGDAYALVDQIPDQSTDLIVTSPPYWGLRTYGHSHNEGILEWWTSQGLSVDRVPAFSTYSAAGGVLGMEPYPAWYVTHLVEWFSRARRVLLPSASVWVNLGDTYYARWSSIRDGGRQGLSDGRQRRRTPSGGYLHDKQLLMIPARFAIAMQEDGWILRNDLIWSKESPIPRPETDRLRLTHEHWFHFVQRSKTGRPSYFYDLSMAEPGCTDVVTTPTSTAGARHSATFPVQVVAPRIGTSSPPGGLVLDPFAGSGRAVADAVRQGRRGLGFELSSEYAHAAAKALAEVVSPMGRHRATALERPRLDSG